MFFSGSTRGFICLFLILIKASTTISVEQGIEDHPSANPNENLEECVSTCNHAKTSRVFLNPNGSLPQIHSTCFIKQNLSSLFQQKSCKFSLPHVQKDILQFLEGKDLLGKAFTHYMRFLCSTPMRVGFTSRTLKELKSAIGYLAVQGCDMNWDDIARYAEMVDLRVFSLTDWENNYEEEENSTEGISTVSVDDTRINCNLTVDLHTYPSLTNIGSLSIVSFSRGQLPQLPTVLTDFYWPNMAEMMFWNTSLPDIPTNDLQLSMPNLQALELYGNMLKKPTYFPWTSSYFFLPLNISRSEVFNKAHYAKDINLAPNLYRRVFDLSGNQITDLRNFSFHGLMQKIKLATNNLQYTDKDTFANVQGLEVLDLSHNLLTELHQDSFRNLVNITSLFLQHNNITSIPPTIFGDLASLKTLDLSHNSIMEIQARTFESQTLERIDLSFNRIVHISHTAIIHDAPKLVSVEVSNNDVTVLPKWVFTQRNLEIIDFSNNEITFDTFVSVLDLLTEEDLTYHSVNDVSSVAGSTSTSNRKSIILQNNNFTDLDTSNIQDINKLKLSLVLSFFNIDLTDNDITCHCRSFNFSSFILEITKTDIRNPYYETAWKCAKPSDLRGTPIIKVPKESFRCEVDIKDCPVNCTCYSRTIDGAIIVDCSWGGLKEFPEVIPNGTISVNVSHNYIQELAPMKESKATLKVLDLSHNEFERVDSDVIKSFNTTEAVYLHSNELADLPREVTTLENVTLTLSDNPFRCDCNNKWMKHWLESNIRIKDKEDIQCVTGKGQHKNVLGVNDDEFVCPTSSHVSGVSIKTLVAIGVASVLTIITSVLTYRFRGEIKVWIFIYFKVHPFDKSENEDIQYMDYDVFISYSNQDCKWVCRTLLPNLETKSPPFRACLHDRDFKIGELISQNISESVQKSRRMIMVLSRNYLQSDWCMHEFQVAHDKVLKERTNYLLVVILDDITCDDVTDDMKKYIKTNTYIHVSNRWFWDKLYYALPQIPLCQFKDLPKHLGLLEDNDDYSISESTSTSVSRLDENNVTMEISHL